MKESFNELRFLSIQQRAEARGLRIEAGELDFVIYRAKDNQFLSRMDSLNSVNSFLAGWIYQQKEIEYIKAENQEKIREFAKWLTNTQTYLIHKPASKTVEQRKRRSASLDVYKLCAAKFEEVFDGGQGSEN